MGKLVSKSHSNHCVNRTFQSNRPSSAVGLKVSVVVKAAMLFRPRLLHFMPL